MHETFAVSESTKMQNLVTVAVCMSGGVSVREDARACPDMPTPAIRPSACRGREAITR